MKAVIKWVLILIGVLCGSMLTIAGVSRGIDFVKDRREAKLHGMPPGTYEVNMEDWNE